MGFRLAVIVSKCPWLKNVYKSNGRCLKSPTTKETKEGNNREVLSLRLTQDWTWFMIGCGVLATIDQGPLKEFQQVQ